MYQGLKEYIIALTPIPSSRFFLLRIFFLGFQLGRLRFLAGMIGVLIIDLIIGYLMLLILEQSVAS